MATPSNPTNTLKPVLDETFKFKVGDLVAVRAHMAMWDMEFELNGPRPDDRYLSTKNILPPGLMTIVERLVVECHGGVQIQYGVSGYQDTKGGGPTVTRKFEYELLSPNDAMVIARKFMPVKKEDK